MERIPDRLSDGRLVEFVGWGLSAIGGLGAHWALVKCLAGLFGDLVAGLFGDISALLSRNILAFLLGYLLALLFWNLCA